MPYIDESHPSSIYEAAKITYQFEKSFVIIYAHQNVFTFDVKLDKIHVNVFYMLHLPIKEVLTRPPYMNQEVI